MTKDKIKSEWEKEFRKEFNDWFIDPINENLDEDCRLRLEQFIQDQIDKAYSKGIQLGYTKHLKEELLKSIKKLSIQSKGKERFNS